MGTKRRSTFECRCQVCSYGCTLRPGWPLPAEAEAYLDAGLAHRLMLDYWARNDGTKNDVGILCPAIVGREGQAAPFWPHGPCTFYVGGRCEIHSTKPHECGVAGCAAGFHDDGEAYSRWRFSIVRAWNTPRGRAAVERWRTVVGSSARPAETENALRDVLSLVVAIDQSLTGGAP